jgi:hypothetical protein
MPATTWSQPNRECVGVAPMWSEDNVPPPPAATGATAGTPGTFTPPGSTPPANVAGMSGLTASPTSPWTVGQYVQTGTAGAAGQAFWTGSSWAAGQAPAA